MDETEYLLSNHANAEHLLLALKEQGIKFESINEYKKFLHINNEDSIDNLESSN
jgi:hypothetical protein